MIEPLIIDLEGKLHESFLKLPKEEQKKIQKRYSAFYRAIRKLQEQAKLYDFEHEKLLK